MEKRVETGWLLDFYGPLLTARQQELMALYCEEDMSLGEIAQQEQISRQGVHDAIRRAELQLRTYERQLGLMERFRTLRRVLGDCQEELSRLPEDARQLPSIQKVGQMLAELARSELG